MGICDSCHGGCCRAFAVPVTGADIIAIRRKLGLPFEEFVRRTPDPSGRISNGAVPHFSFNDSPDTPYVICLTHAPSVFHARSTKCRFLIESQPDEEFPLGRARCGIYGVRPSACRVFPTKFNATNDLAIVCDIPDRFRDNTNPAYTLCPRPWAPEDVDPIQAVQDLAVVTYELAFFRQVAELWNRVARIVERLSPVLGHRVCQARGTRSAGRNDRRRRTGHFAVPKALRTPGAAVGSLTRRPSCNCVGDDVERFHC